MKTILYLFLCGLSINGLTGQVTHKLKEYKASNDITYKIGDRIELNKGADPSGKFIYVNDGGWLASSDDESNKLGHSYAGQIFTIKKIKKHVSKTYEGVFFILGGGNITNYNIDIERAIETCEIRPCTESVNNNVELIDKYDQLRKIKDLLDDGVLTQEEFNVEKKKILKQ